MPCSLFLSNYVRWRHRSVTKAIMELQTVTIATMEELQTVTVATMELLP